MERTLIVLKLNIINKKLKNSQEVKNILTNIYRVQVQTYDSIIVDTFVLDLLILWVFFVFLFFYNDMMLQKLKAETKNT